MVRATLDLEGSCDLAAGGVERGDRFVLARFGDGDLYCMKADTDVQAAEMLQATLGERPGRPPLALADGEVWSPELRDALRSAWVALTGGQHSLLLGDPRTSAYGIELFPYWDSIGARVRSGRDYILVHHEMFWLRSDPQPGLLRFCRAVRGSLERKLLVGRNELGPAAELVGADFCAVDPFESLWDTERVCAAADDYEMVLICAGRGGKAIMHGLLDRPRTLLDLGSLFDPLYVGNSRPRPGAPSDADAERFFSELAGAPVAVAETRPGRAFAPA